MSEDRSSPAYLVPSLRDWVTRQQRATLRGRADLLFAERYALWKIKEGNQYLLSVPELVVVLVLSSKKGKTPHHRLMVLTSLKYNYLKGIASLIISGIAVAILGRILSGFSFLSDHPALFIPTSLLLACLLLFMVYALDRAISDLRRKCHIDVRKS